MIVQKCMNALQQVIARHVSCLLPYCNTCNAYVRVVQARNSKIARFYKTVLSSEQHFAGIFDVQIV